jgi:hypothetical protein
MTPDEFIAALKVVVHDSSVRGVLETLAHPGGRKPAPRLLELAQWFSSLSELDRVRVAQVIQLSVHSGIFGTLAVLDGASAIESGSKKGRLKLTYERGDEARVLNDNRSEDLHDIYQHQVYDLVFGPAA